MASPIGNNIAAIKAFRQAADPVNRLREGIGALTTGGRMNAERPATDEVGLRRDTVEISPEALARIEERTAAAQERDLRDTERARHAEAEARNQAAAQEARRAQAEARNQAAVREAARLRAEAEETAALAREEEVPQVQDRDVPTPVEARWD